MLSSVDERKNEVARHEEVIEADFEYDDGEVIIEARLDEWPTDEFEAFLEDLGLTLRTAPRDLGPVYGVEVQIDDRDPGHRPGRVGGGLR